MQKEREQEYDLDLKTKMPKCMANASFYRPKFGTIDLMTTCWVGGHILTWWQSLSSCLNKMSLITLEFEQIFVMKVLGNCLSFPKKKNRCIWASRTRDMGWTEQCMGCRTDSDFSVVAKIWTSKQQNWVLHSHECFRPMS